MVYMGSQKGAQNVSVGFGDSDDGDDVMLMTLAL